MAFRTDRRPISAVLPTVNGANPMLVFVKRPRRDQTVAADQQPKGSGPVGAASTGWRSPAAARPARSAGAFRRVAHSTL